MTRAWKKRSAAVARGRPRREQDQASCEISPESKSSAGADQLPLVDRYGHRHSEGILTSWSPAALKALGVVRRGET